MDYYDYRLLSDKDGFKYLNEADGGFSSLNKSVTIRVGLNYVMMKQSDLLNLCVFCFLGWRKTEMLQSVEMKLITLFVYQCK